MLTKLLHKHIALVSFLKHFFVPHHGNNYKPHFFKEHIQLSLLIVSLTVLILSFTSYLVLRTTAFGNNVVTSVLIDLTNETRKEYNLPPVSENIRLDQASFLKARDMDSHQYFAHTAPDGTEPWYWFSVVGYPFLYAGENLALNFTSSQDTQKAWLASKKHRDNILDPRYTDIGIAVVRGTKEIKPTLFIVQLFGTPQKETYDTPLYTTSRWYELALFNASYYARNIFQILIIVLGCMLFLMIAIEVRKQHIQHVIYGVLLFIIISLCAVINSLLV